MLRMDEQLSLSIARLSFQVNPIALCRPQILVWVDGFRVAIVPEKPIDTRYNIDRLHLEYVNVAIGPISSNSSIDTQPLLISIYTQPFVSVFLHDIPSFLGTLAQVLALSAFQPSCHPLSYVALLLFRRCEHQI